MRYLLDTDHLTYLERGGEEGLRIRIRLLMLPISEYGTTVITYEEQMRGWLARIARAQGTDQLVEAYARLNVHIEVFKELPVLPFDKKSAAEFERLRTLRLRIGSQDLKIASIAIANQATLLTHNISDFSKITDLNVEDWSI